MANAAPDSLELLNVEIMENQPDDTIVGKLVGSDPDGNVTLHYSRAQGKGSRDNNLFFVGPHNNLRSKHPLDFEANATLLVRLKVTDEHNASLEQRFVINLLNDPTDDPVAPDETYASPEGNYTTPDTSYETPRVTIRARRPDMIPRIRITILRRIITVRPRQSIQVPKEITPHLVMDTIPRMETMVLR